MKKRIFAIALALTMVLGLTVTAHAAPAPAIGTINVNGTGSIAADPDMAMVQLGARTFGTTAAEAIGENVVIIDAIIEALLALGIEEESIQTSSYSMWPETEWRVIDARTQLTGPVHVGFSVTHTLTITINDIDLIGYVLTAAAEAGSNQNSGINFLVRDNSALYHEAMQLAIKDAIARAEVAAAALGVELGAPIAFTESVGWFDPFWGGTGGLFARAGMVAEMSLDSTIGVQVGQVGVTANVSITFEFAR
ncbi:MAG: SIMPL domain-containing protein [Defluviitaleaceae bacterium]|nr:SIMPL domain-containing protein [Defluviitaleaceae bacterium]